VARREKPTTTGVGGTSRALAHEEHISKRLRGVAGGVNAGAAAKIGCDALGKWIHGSGDIRYRLSDISFGGEGHLPAAIRKQEKAYAENVGHTESTEERRKEGERRRERKRKR